MKEKIHYLIKELNSSKNLPNKWLRRNIRYYELVSAMNNCICLYLADNITQNIIDRCYKYLDVFDIQNKEPKYYFLAKEILDLISKEFK